MSACSQKWALQCLQYVHSTQRFAGKSVLWLRDNTTYTPYSALQANVFYGCVMSIRRSFGTVRKIAKTHSWLRRVCPSA